MKDEFRLGEKHLADVTAVATDLNRRFPGLPLFLVGTSRGTISAAAVGARMSPPPAGVVLTATVFRATSPRARDPGRDSAGSISPRSRSRCCSRIMARTNAT